MYVSTGPVTGECPAEESGDRDLNIEQHITDTIDPKLVMYTFVDNKFTLPPLLLTHPTTIIIHIHIHNHHYSEPSSVNLTPADVSGADVSGDENGNHTYQVPNPIIHTPHPITGVIYTDINPQRTKKGQKVSKEVDNPMYNCIQVCCYTCRTSLQFSSHLIILYQCQKC